MADLTVPALTGKAITCTITGGNGLLESSGTFDVLLENPGPGQYTIPVGTGSVVAHTGTYTLTQYPPDLSFLQLNGYASGIDWVEFELHTAAAVDSTPGKPFFSFLTVKGGSMQGYKDGWYSLGTPGVGSTPAPSITSQPVSQFVALNGTVTFSITVTGSGLSYQWYFNGVAISGAIQATYSISGVGSANVGDYTVKVTNAGGSVTSSKATLSIASLPSITVPPAGGRVAAGASFSLSVTATGAGLSYQWYKDNVAITGAVSANFSIGRVRPSDAGSYTVSVSNASGTVTSAAAVLSVDWSQLVNLSILGLSKGKATPLTAGFVVSGGSKKLLVRAVGPGLSVFGVAGVLANPSMQLHNSVSGKDSIEVSNDNWSDSDAVNLAAAFAATGAFALGAGSKDAALLRTVDGARTVQVMDDADVSGVTLIEVYDAAPDMDGRLVNLSARNIAGNGDKMLTIGFSVTGTANRKVLIRGIGPGLSPFGVTSVLPDPRLEVFRIVNGTPGSIATNDNWGSGDISALRAAFATAGAFDLTDASSKDAALVLSLAPGLYSAQVSSTDAQSGDALVEVYELP